MPSERLSYHAVGGPAAYIMLSSPHRVQDVLEKAFIDGQLDAELACGAQLRRWPVMVKLLNQRQAAQRAESKREETAKAIAMAQAARTDAEMASAYCIHESSLAGQPGLLDTRTSTGFRMFQGYFLV